MPPSSSLMWVNKTQTSCSLSNCHDEEHTLRQIRTRAVIAGHTSSRVRRPIDRNRLPLGWAQKTVATYHVSQLKPTPAKQDRSRQGRSYDFPMKKIQELSLHEHWSRSGSEPSTCHAPDSPDSLILESLGSEPDPFSCFAISLDKVALDKLWYLENIWSQSAFKLPRCIGYNGQAIERSEVTSLVQQCLASTTQIYCLLAAISSRMYYIHSHKEISKTDGDEQAHTYASKAISGLRQRLQDSDGSGEETTMNMLFLAVYEIFCENESGAEMHLLAVKRLQRKDFSNKFVSTLQANLEVLVAGTVAGDWHLAVDKSVRSR